MSETLICPRCNSVIWNCWDEQNEIFQSDDNPEEIAYLPVGYIVCGDCGARWTSHDHYGWTWLGRDEDEAFGISDNYHL